MQRVRNKCKKKLVSDFKLKSMFNLDWPVKGTLYRTAQSKTNKSAEFGINFDLQTIFFKKIWRMITYAILMDFFA